MTAGGWRRAALMCAVIASAACGKAGDKAASDRHLRSAVAHGERPADDRARDGDRKPVEVLGFFGLEPGHRVAELMSGRGYYAEILARAVGPEGRVYVHNSPFVLARFADEPISQRLARLDLDHVVRADGELEALPLPDGELDLVLMVLFYHDTYWQKVDRAAMLREIRRALKPGGIFGLIDHHAAAGSGDRDVETLHRVDAELVRREVEAAGFTLDGTSDLLRNRGDDRTVNVFEEAIRGKTDRFIYRFRKPE